MTTPNEQVPDLEGALKEREQETSKYFDMVKAWNEVIVNNIFEHESYETLFDGVLGYQFKECHNDMIKFQDKNPKSLVLAPRGIGKSTVLTVGRVIFELIRNRNIRILITSNTQLQAEIFLREIKTHFEANEKLIEVFGDLVGDKWDGKEINIKGRKTFAKESSVSCCGVGGAIVGRHYDLIVADDLVDEENARTELQRERFRIWFYKALFPTLEPDGRFFMHGTRYYPSDHYGYVINKDEDFKHKVFPAIVKNDKGEESSIWAEKMSLEWLYGRKRALGSAIFESQYMNSTHAMEGKIFQYEHFRYYDILPPDLKIYQGIDLAISKKETADYFVICTIGIDDQKRIFVIDVFKTRLSFLKQYEAIVERFDRFKPMRVFIESNAYQGSQASMLLATTDVRVKPLITLKDKVTRAWHISSKFENGMVFFPRYGMDDFKEELISFPDVDHDDQLDAFMLALEGTTKKRKKPRSEPGLI